MLWLIWYGLYGMAYMVWLIWYGLYGMAYMLWLIWYGLYGMAYMVWLRDCAQRTFSDTPPPSPSPVKFCIVQLTPGT